MKDKGNGNRNVCGNSGKTIRTILTGTGEMIPISLNPAKKGNYSVQFVCELCGRSTDAHLCKDGEFHVTSHIVKGTYLKTFQTEHIGENFRTMGTRKGKTESVPSSNVA